MGQSDAAVASPTTNGLRHLDLINIVRVRSMVAIALGGVDNPSFQQFGVGEGDCLISGWNHPYENPRGFLYLHSALLQADSEISVHVLCSF